ncbi:phosphotransferase [Nocardioides euryhalodurans]|uniref:Phosphotransferase n=1 Tax=Nocardioides euryhalodurans TaxID=2518370 RepID=A0A4P7GGX6_9ACTN|nr:phosphotransferase [Nocardioides euryhalodurans]QBR91076.1 phosphotransferase [Nocardioides euryhalodurans]
MWEPEPDWHPLPGGTGTSTVGVWRAALGDQPVVVKRLARPAPHDPGELSQPAHFAYWRREADTLSTGIVGSTDGLRAPSAAVEEDTEGITITREWVEDAATSGLFVAMALGRFAGSLVVRPTFLARDQLRDRLTRVERRGGWPTLARTPVADVADHLWKRRQSMLDRVDALPQVPQHGDPAPANLPGREADHVVAIDWAMLGVGHVGSDLGLYSLASREEFDPLLEAYLMGLPDGLASAEDVVTGARVTAVYTALTRADWALERVSGGEGALVAKFRHPAVAPHLRTLQRQFAQIEALLEE